MDLPYPGYISDADRGNTNVLCYPIQPPEASGAAPCPWGGHQQGTALCNVCSGAHLWIASSFMEVM